MAAAVRTLIAPVRAVPVAVKAFAPLVAPVATRSFAAAADGGYDVVVVGGGPGGYVAAIKAAQLGLKTACVDSRGAPGGTCLNVGCIPSKAMLHASHLYSHAKHGAYSGWGVEVGDVSLDLDKMLAAKDESVKGLTGGIEFLFKKNGVDYVKGFGKLTGPNTVTAALNEGGETVLDTKNVIIATGSEVAPLPPVPVDNAGQRIVDSTGALELQKVPESMVVVGGGVIGLEMGSVWSRLGAKVTVVEFLDRIIPGTDAEIAKRFQAILKKQGFSFKLGTKVTSSTVTDTGVSLTMEPAKGGDSQVMEADVVLVSTGRRPYTEGLGLEELGIATDRLGRIEVDDDFCTSVPHIRAIGDCIKGPMLAHKAEEEGIAAAENIAGGAGHVNYGVIPGVIYTTPEVASVGMTEEDLKDAGVKYNKGKFPFSANSRAAAIQEKNGFVKILADAETDEILGIHIIGDNAGEMIAEGCLAMEYGASSEDVARTCHAHPTLSEAFKEAAMDAYSSPIHM